MDEFRQAMIKTMAGKGEVVGTIFMFVLRCFSMFVQFQTMHHCVFCSLMIISWL